MEDSLQRDHAKAASRVAEPGQEQQAGAADGSLQALTSLIDRSLDEIVVLDSQGHVELVNESARHAAGAVNGDLHDLSLLSTYTTEELLGVLRDLRGARFIRRRLKRRGEDGVREQDVLVWPLRNAQGEIEHVALVACDDRAPGPAWRVATGLQNAVLTAASEWRHTVDAIEWPIVLFDKPSIIRRMNRAARDLLGETDYSRVGIDLVKLNRGEPWPTILDLVERAASGRTLQTCHVSDPASGTTWEITASLASPDAELSYGVIVVARDISAMLRIQDSLRRSETLSEMGHLVASVAHEVKTPLFGISATLEAMVSRFSGHSEFLPYAQVLTREVGRLRALMRDLLDFGRPVELRLEAVHLGNVIAAAVAMVAEAARNKGVQIDNRVRADFGRSVGDPLQLQQVFRNLLENAISFSPPGGSVTVEAKGVDGPQGGRFVMRVCDNGPGFAAELLPRLFRPFVSSRPGGTGLGLSVVQRIVEAHGGTVVAGNHPKGGAEVTVDLPAHSGQES